MQLNSTQLREALPWNALISALQTIFTRDVHAPIRHHHTLNVPGEAAATLLLMPAWLEGEFYGVKQVGVFPGNNQRGMPGLSSHYMLSCGKTGQPLAQMDGNELTGRRTAAASALASSFLSRSEASELLMVGAGRVGRQLIPAHMSVRPIRRVRIWDRNFDASSALAQSLQAEGIEAIACSDDQLEAAAREADIVSCATMATEPVIRGEWLKPGAHLDLVGSFTPHMRETDDEAMRRCHIFVDVKAAALQETGELIMPIRDGVISAGSVRGELTELCRGEHSGRAGLDDPDTAITLFKSVGDSREDLAAAILAYQRSVQQ